MSPKDLLHPDLSRLAFEERLIQFCEDDATPLLERVRLLGIAAGRLDTFFMTRIGRLKRLAALERTRGPKATTGQTIAAQLEMVAAESHRIVDRAYRLLEAEIISALEAEGVCITAWEALSAAEQEQVRAGAGSKLASTVRLLEIVPPTPFPHVRNLRPAVIAIARGTPAADAPIVVCELPEGLPRFVRVDQHRLVPLEAVLGAMMPSLWPKWSAEHVHVFRVTRSAIMELESERDEDMMEVVEQEVALRPFQEVVRVEFERNMPVSLQTRLLHDLGWEAEMQGSSLSARDMYGALRLLDLAALEEIAALDLPKLKAAPIQPRVAKVGSSVIDHVLKRDLLVRFPFDDYESTIQRVLTEASQRDDVESIRITLYRAGREAKAVAALREARARGVDVTAIVELKASFDERDNIELARALEADGVRVVLSPTELKVHAKIALVTLRTGGETRRVAMIGTGNLNAQTAQSYLDHWLLTSDAERTTELNAVFGFLTGRGKGGADTFRHLLVAPINMRQRFLELIEREALHARAGKLSGIRATINGLTDTEIIAALCRASQAGVNVDLMVRSVCALQPGVPGMSENVRVVSVVGRLLQHGRIFQFRNGGADEFFMGSADWRPRNLDHRVEVVTRVRAEHHEPLSAALDEALSDDGAWELRSDGVYVRGAARRRERGDAVRAASRR